MLDLPKLAAEVSRLEAALCAAERAFRWLDTDEAREEADAHYLEVRGQLHAARSRIAKCGRPA